MTKQEFVSLLIVGAEICIGKEYSEFTNGRFKQGQIITLIKGWFEHDNGLYCEDKECPSIWDDEEEDFESIYHLFGNNFEYFMDCEILKSPATDGNTNKNEYTSKH